MSASHYEQNNNKKISTFSFSPRIFYKKNNNALHTYTPIYLIPILFQIFYKQPLLSQLM